MSAVPLELIEPNQQRPERRVEVDDGSLDIQEIFPTIQGEGPFAGEPAIFIRLAGCNLQCPRCDTDYTSKRQRMSLPEIMKALQDLHPHKLVVLTGGEPFRQPLGPLVRMMPGKFHIQIESNGTIYDPSLEGFWHHVTLVCSPKTPTIHEKLYNVINNFKYVLRHGEVAESDGLPMRSLGLQGLPARPPLYWKGRVYVQPLDEGDEKRNTLNLKAAMDSCMEWGYTLCLQQHKLIGLP